MYSSTVTIVTRTKNRAILLRRAIQSVYEQSFKDYIHIIVNDGGDPDEVKVALEQTPHSSEKVKVIHNDRSLGMEAATNCALKIQNSEFVVIHDDDDSWQPNFLEETVSFLNSDSRYGGVVTKSMEIRETLTDQRVDILSATPFYSHVNAITFFELAKANTFPPIAFLYRTSVLQQAGMYDESLPVLGDWEFNLRFLSKASIAMLPKHLANYHIRTASTNASAGNSVTAGFGRHLEYRRLLNDRYLRTDVSKGALGFGFLINYAYDALRTSEGQSLRKWLKRRIRESTVFLALIRFRNRNHAIMLQRRFHS